MGVSDGPATAGVIDRDVSTQHAEDGARRPTAGPLAAPSLERELFDDAPQRQPLRAMRATCVAAWVTVVIVDNPEETS